MSIALTVTPVTCNSLADWALLCGGPCSRGYCLKDRACVCSDSGLQRLSKQQALWRLMVHACDSCLPRLILLAALCMSHSMQRGSAPAVGLRGVTQRLRCKGALRVLVLRVGPVLRLPCTAEASAVSRNVMKQPSCTAAAACMKGQLTTNWYVLKQPLRIAACWATGCSQIRHQLGREGLQREVRVLRRRQDALVAPAAVARVLRMQHPGQT